VDQAFTNLADLFTRYDTPAGVLIPSGAWLILARKP
jgi:hypothetical protein